MGMNEKGLYHIRGAGMEQEKKTPLQRANRIILILHIVFPVWLFALMYTSAISGYLFFIAFTAALLLGGIYSIVSKLQKGKIVLYIARVITILCIAAFYTPMILLVTFSHTKSLYEIKRLDYAYGVFGSNADYYKQLLPEKLTSVCEDYSFRTQGSMIAQDYHPSSYLMFHTDAATMDLYADYYKGLDCDVRINDEDNDKAKSDIEWFCSQMRLRESFHDNLDHAELYWFSGTYPKAVLLNRETGLVAVLT